MSENTRNRILLWLILLFALVVRLYRFDWGLPWVRWGDEHTIISYSAFISLNKTLNPFNFHYSSLVFYFVSVLGWVIYAVLNLLGVDVDWDTFWLSFFGDPTILTISARIFQAFIGVVTVYIVFEIGQYINKKIALFSALIFALSPLAVIESKKYGGDGIMAFFCAVALLFVVRYITTQRAKYLLISALFAGFAAGTKYFGGVVLVSLWTGMYFTQKSLKRVIKSGYFWLSIVFAMIGFLISSPYIVITPFRFFKDLGYEFFHILSGHLGFEHAPPAPVGNIFHLVYALGIAGFIVFVFGVILGFRRKDKIVIALVMFPLAIYLITAFGKTSFARYFCSLLPSLVVVSAYGFEWLWRQRRFLFWVMALLALAEFGVRTYGILRYFSLPISDDIAREWIVKNLPADAKIAAMNPGALFFPSTVEMRAKLEKSIREHKVDSLKYIGMLRFAPVEYRRDMCKLPAAAGKYRKSPGVWLKEKVKKILGKSASVHTSPVDIWEKLKECDAFYFVAQSQYYMRHFNAPDVYPDYVEFYNKIFQTHPLFEVGNEFVTTREIPPLKVLITAKVAGQKYRIYPLK